MAYALCFRRSTGVALTLPLHAQTAAAFFAEYQTALASLGVAVKIHPMPVELAAQIRFDLDETHASYDRAAGERFHRVLMRCDTLFKQFSTRFLGKISPVHFFWGSFDLCVTRFSGRVAAGPPRPDKMQAEAYSHEVISCGFWTRNGGYGSAAFYCYAAPVPSGLGDKTVQPGHWNAAMGEFLMGYDEVQRAVDPAATVMDFLQATYAAAAECAGWDRAALERAETGS